MMNSKAMRSLVGLRQTLEILFVLGGFTKTARITVHEGAQFRHVEDFLSKLGLHTQPSSVKFLLPKKKRGLVFANFSVPVPLVHKEKGIRYFYIARDQNGARLAKMCDERKHSDLFAQLLGYPRCCVDFYNKHMQECLDEKIDLCLKVLAKTTRDYPYPYQMNIVAQYFDAALFSHYPCSFSCQASLSMAKKRLVFLERKKPTLAREVKRTLKTAVLFTQNKGICMLKGRYDKKNQRYHADVITPNLQGKALAKFVASSKHIEVLGQKRVKLVAKKGRVRSIQGKTVGMFVFC